MFRYPFASTLSTTSGLKKRMDYSLVLKGIGYLPYGLSAELAFWRGKALLHDHSEVFKEIKENLRTVFTDWDDQRLFLEAKKIFEYASLEEAEGARIALKRGKYLEKWVKISGLEHLHQAVSMGKGVIITFLHMGSFASVLCRLGQILPVPIHAIAWPYQECSCPVFRSFIHKKVEGMRGFMKGRFFFVGQIPVKELYSALDHNEMLVILIDAPIGKSARVEVNFLKKKGRFPLSAFKIAARKGIPVLPIAVYRKDGDLTIRADILTPHSVESLADCQRVFQSVLSDLENYIYRYPAQFFYWTSPTSWRTIDKI